MAPGFSATVETPSVTVLRIHYRTQYGWSISVRGTGEGLFWDWGKHATFTSDNGEDVWELRLPVEVPDSIIEFKPLLNDCAWARGCNYKTKAGSTMDIYPFFVSERGTVVKKYVPSKILNNERKVAIYLPPSYDENTYKSYPVFVFGDGHNLFDNEDSFCGVHWQIGEAMDALTCTGGIKEAIIVGPYPVDRDYEYLPTTSDGLGGGADKYLDFITKELRPFVNKHFRTIKSGPVGIAGSSWGGVISFYAWLTRPEEFDVCGAFSPSTKWDNRVLISMCKEKLTTRPPSHKLYLDCGTIKDEAKATRELHAYISTREDALPPKQYMYVIAEGHEHTEYHWSLRSPDALAFMLEDPDRVQYNRGDIKQANNITNNPTNNNTNNNAITA